MSVQDDAREDIMVKIFNLKQDDDRARHDPDAYLDFESHRFQFELKSTTKNSISTVRDFGPDHIQKWLDMHWIVGFFKAGVKSPTYCYYLAPNDMREWTDNIWSSIKFDFEMADIAASKISIDDLYSSLGAKNVYTLSDAKAIQKSQYLAKDYRDRMDVMESGFSAGKFFTFCAPFISNEWVIDNIGKKSVYSSDDLKVLMDYQGDAEKIRVALGGKNEVGPSSYDLVFPKIFFSSPFFKGDMLTLKKAAAEMRRLCGKSFANKQMDVVPGYSPSAMLEILKDRCRYLIKRGATLNNPHIAESFFSRFDKIEDEHASQLRKKLKAYLDSAA